MNDNVIPFVRRVADDRVNDFGGCPTCHGNDGFFNAGKGHWFVCHAHRVRWFVGSNLFSSWRDETEEQQRHAHDVDPGWGSYQSVDSYNPPNGSSTAS